MNGESDFVHVASEHDLAFGCRVNHRPDIAHDIGTDFVSEWGCVASVDLCGFHFVARR